MGPVSWFSVESFGHLEWEGSDSGEGAALTFECSCYQGRSKPAFSREALEAQLFSLRWRVPVASEPVT